MRFFCVLFFVFCGISYAEYDEAKTRQVAFSVGVVEVSSYIYERELAKAQGRSRAVDSEAWFADWVQRLRLTNRAIEEGYLDSAEVKRTTRIMSSHILLHGREGPLQRLVLDEELKTKFPNFAAMIPREQAQAKHETREALSAKLSAGLEIEVNEAKVAEALRWLSRFKIEGLPIAPDAEWLYRYRTGDAWTADSLATFQKLFFEKVIKRVPRTAEKLERFIRTLVIDKLLMDFARERGLDQDAFFQNELTNFRYEVAYNQYIDRELEAASEQLSDEAVRAYFDAHREMFQTPSKSRIAILQSPRGDLVKQATLKLSRSSDRPSLLQQFRDDPSIEVLETEVDEVTALQSDRELLRLPIGGAGKASKSYGTYRVAVKLEDIAHRVPDFETIRSEVSAKLEAELKAERLAAENREVADMYPLVRNF